MPDIDQIRIARYQVTMSAANTFTEQGITLPVPAPAGGARQFVMSIHGVAADLGIMDIVAGGANEFRAAALSLEQGRADTPGFADGGLIYRRFIAAQAQAAITGATDMHEMAHPAFLWLPKPMLVAQTNASLYMTTSGQANASVGNFIVYYTIDEVSVGDLVAALSSFGNF